MFRQGLNWLHATNSSLSREPALDAIRGVAITMVLAFHFLDQRSGVATTDGVMWGIGYFSSFGWAGVQLFFVLSGFLIGGILIDHQLQEGYFRTFYLRRFVRIIPLYAVSLLIFGLLHALYDWRTAGLSGVFDLEIPILYLLSLTQNFFLAVKGDWAGPGWLGVTWSLCVEEQFYLLLPFIIRLVSPRRLPAVCATAILAAPLFRIVVLALWPDNRVAPYVLLPGRMDALFFGVLGACLWRDEQARHLVLRHRPAIRAAFVLTSVMLIANLHRMGPFGYKTQTIGFTIIAGYFFAAILLALSSAKAAGWLALARTPLCLAGIGAYSLYLFHRPIQTFVQLAMPARPVPDLLVSLLLVAVVSWLCWNFIEAPAIRFGRRAFQYGDGSSTAVETYELDLPVARQLP